MTRWSEQTPVVRVRPAPLPRCCAANSLMWVGLSAKKPLAESPIGRVNDRRATSLTPLRLARPMTLGWKRTLASSQRCDRSIPVQRLMPMPASCGARILASRPGFPTHPSHDETAHETKRSPASPAPGARIHCLLISRWPTAFAARSRSSGSGRTMRIPRPRTAPVRAAAADRQTGSSRSPTRRETTDTQAVHVPTNRKFRATWWNEDQRNERG